MVVDCPSTGIIQTFPCQQWLAKDEGDGLVERRLEEDRSLRVTRAPSKFIVFVGGIVSKAFF